MKYINLNADDASRLKIGDTIYNGPGKYKYTISEIRYNNLTNTHQVKLVEYNDWYNPLLFFKPDIKTNYTLKHGGNV